MSIIHPYDRGIHRASIAASAKVFRGTLPEFARGIQLGRGYILPAEPKSYDNLCRNCRVKGLKVCRHFEIDTCRQLSGPMTALLDPNVQTAMVLKAVQTLGSLIWDIWLHYIIVHSHFYRIKVFINDEKKALRYCDERLMPTLRANPEISHLIPIGGISRYDATKTSIIFTNGKSVEILGLNDSNASSLTADVVVIDEGWEHGSDGLMQKAIDRTKQSRSSGRTKVFIVGQAGNKKEDQDGIWDKLDKIVRGNWACPNCNGRQTYGEFGPSITRPKDFKQLIGKVPTGKELKPGSYAGLKVARPFSSANSPEEIRALSKTATLECLHCGFEIEDNRLNRRALSESLDQEYRVDGPMGLYTPKDYSVGFWNPDPASETISYADTMHAYIVAKKAKEDYQNIIPLRDFYQNRWATAWDEKMTREIRARMQEAYDIQSDWPEEWKGRRVLIVDCQHELQHFWASAWAVSKTGKSRQLWRGLARGFGDETTKSTWTPESKEPPTLCAIQKHFGILHQRVFLDGKYMTEELVEECAKHGHWGIIDGERLWLCWNLLCGSAQKNFSHADDQNSKLRYPISDSYQQYPKFKVDGETVTVEMFYYAKTQTSQMAARYRDGNSPEMLCLPETEDPENNLSWTAQINSCYPHFEQNKKTGEFVEIWKADKQSTPTHFWDNLTMLMAVFCLWNLVGAMNTMPEPKTVEVK